MVQIIDNNTKWRQKLHIEPPKGWLNDPNGLCFFKGEYHVYFQYSPDSPKGAGRKCWGHYKSADLCNWIFTGTVLFPDLAEDRSGVYSGCGFVKDDTLYLFYTGNVKEPGNHDYIKSGRGANVILVTTKDGHVMSEKKVLLRNSDYPSYCSCHVRDPKVWEEDGKYRMVLGARSLSDTGLVIFYESDDLINWRFEKEITAEDFGYMWECPDVIDVGGKRFLGISPQGLNWPENEKNYKNVYSAGFREMKGDELGGFTEWDCGFDFYAPQTFTAPDGRTLLIGWMGIGDIPYSNPTTELGWQHCLTLMRELSLSEDGELCQKPVKELETLVSGEKRMPDEAKLPFRLSGQVNSKDFSINLAGGLKLVYKDSVFSMIFEDDGLGYGRKVRKTVLDKCSDIQVIADTSSIEVYLDGGRKVFGTRFYPQSDVISIEATDIDLTLEEMKPMSFEYRGE